VNPDPTQHPDDEVATRLVTHLRAGFGPDLDVTVPLEPLGGGYVNRLFSLTLGGRDLPDPWRGPLVLRLAPPWSPEGKLEREHAVQRRVRQLGYPTPELLLLETDPRILFGPFQVMRRAAGGPLVDQLVRRPLHAPVRMSALGALHRRLHLLPIDDFPTPDAPTAEDLALSRLEAHAAPGPAVTAWLREHRPPPGAPSICHLDFHPLNVLFDGPHPTAVLDWENAGLGDPVHDVADALVVWAHGPSDLPRWLQPGEAQARSLLAQRYLAAYRRLAPVDADRLAYFEVLAAARRLLGAVLDAGDTPEESRGLSSPEYLSALAAFIERRSGQAPLTA